MSNHPCTSCTRPVPDAGSLCSTCTENLRHHLAGIPALLSDLEVTRTRQSKTGGRGIGVVARTEERPLPWDERGSKATAVLRVALTRLVRVLADGRGGRLPEDDPGDIARWLLGRVDQWRMHPQATEMWERLQAALDSATQVTDRAPDLLYVGPCDPHGRIVGDGHSCSRHLYVESGATVVQCPACGTVHEVRDRRALLVDAARDRLATPSELSRFLTAYEQPVSPDRIRKWAERGQLIARGHLPAVGEREPRPLFLIGEALDLLARITDRQPA